MFEREFKFEGGGSGSPDELLGADSDDDGSDDDGSAGCGPSESSAGGASCPCCGRLSRAGGEDLIGGPCVRCGAEDDADGGVPDEAADSGVSGASSDRAGHSRLLEASLAKASAWYVVCVPGPGSLACLG